MVLITYLMSTTEETGVLTEFREHCMREEIILFLEFQEWIFFLVENSAQFQKRMMSIPSHSKWWKFIIKSKESHLLPYRRVKF